MMGSEELTKFYTALYHVFTVPTKFSEVSYVYVFVYVCDCMYVYYCVYY